MPIVLKKADISKKGWQKLRHADLKKTGMGSALDKWAPYAAQSGKFIIIEGTKEKALATVVPLAKALNAAKVKADKIKDKEEKKAALELVHAYKTLLANWMKDISAGAALVKKGKTKSIDNLNLAQVLKDASLRKSLHAFVKSEFSEENLLFLTTASKPSAAAFKEFIGSKAPREVNIPSPITQAIELAEENGELTGATGKKAWTAAVQEVFNMLQRDSFRRWQASLRADL